MEKKLLFLDVDDTFLTPPYKAVKRIANLIRMKNFPSEDEFINRNDINFHLAFPNVFKNKNHMWILALASIPFGFFRSYKVYPSINLYHLRGILSDPRVFLISKNPPSFAPWRVKRINELIGVDITSRYIACGPIFKQSTSKIEIILKIAADRQVELSNCLLIDDDIDNLLPAAKAEIACMLIETPWSKQRFLDCNYLKDSIVMVKRSLFLDNAFKFLGKRKNED